ncbi:GAF domain-containing protein [Chitiniphilus eburneus]|uniref:GAF domain-containing protein n=1 Tax=Chitiniphilus eburneus TaxID=2571148 RepID=A0A4U0PXJ6_9NEIS|nr:GAF domain-containing protein [Chitiniphilus eburneus]TJZ73313.1 GAF domain-containing protein [Chitiniphilus eburneus]
MAEHLDIADGDKGDRYRALLPQLDALLAGEPDPIARMANTAAALAATFGWLWVGFYRVVDDELVLGPFQGPIACTRIAHGKGVCGAAWARNETLVVPDVDAFPGHIACSSAARAEIVVPLRDRAGRVVGVLDVDHHLPAAFDTVDAAQLEAVATLLMRDIV